MTIELGYALSSEEHSPRRLVELARKAEEAGFGFALISDHFHPWTDRQGESPFVWSVLGAIAMQTDRLTVGTGVTCPLIRIHPAIIAQAAATTAALFESRFFLGVGTGENLNEHITGSRWPPADLRRAMLEEAIGLIRELWRGEQTTFRGDYYTVEDARLYTLPTEPPEICVAASATESAELAGRIGDGLIGTAPDADLIEAFEKAGGETAPRYGQLTVCWAETEADARKTALEWWPTAALSGPLSQELPLPSHFEAAAEMITEDEITATIVCGPDPAAHAEAIDAYIDAGYTHVYVHQVGKNQDGFLRLYEQELVPHYSGRKLRAV